MNGERIRQARKRFGYTLKDLSNKTNLSLGYLSNIERNATSPTVDTLEIICKALRMDIAELVRSDQAKSPLTKHNQRYYIYADKDGILENCVAPNSLYRCTCYTMNPSYREPVIVPPWNQGSILCYLLSGNMEISLAEKVYHLEPGDTLLIPGGVPHRFRQLGPEVCKSLWFYQNVIE